MNLLKTEHLRNLPGADNTSCASLPNGITVLVYPNTDSASVVISGYFQAGSMYDPPEKLGLAYLPPRHYARHPDPHLPADLQ